MGLRITGNKAVENNVARAQRDHANSLEKLSSGINFTKVDPMPADRAISEGMGQKIREMSSYKKNANDGISLVQIAEAGLSEISNISIRLKELATQAANPTLSDKERKFLFVEYNGLYNEVERIARSTSYNGISLLTAGEDSRGRQGITFRIGSPVEGEDGNDASQVVLDNIEEVIATPLALGLKSVSSLLSNSDGISLDDVEDLFEASLDTLGGSFDTAFDTLNEFRANFGAVGARLGRAINVIDVGIENISAANSRIKDVDYASELANLTKAAILMQTGASLLPQIAAPAQAILSLIKNID